MIHTHTHTHIRTYARHYIPASPTSGGRYLTTTGENNSEQINIYRLQRLVFLLQDDNVRPTLDYKMQGSLFLKLNMYLFTKIHAELRDLSA